MIHHTNIRRTPLSNNFGFKYQKNNRINGSTCLMLASSNSSSPEVLKVLLEKIVEVGGLALFHSQLATTDNDGSTCLVFAFRSPEVVKLLVATLLFHLDLFSEQYEKLDDYHKQRFKEEARIDSASWAPWSERPEVMKVLLSDIKRICGAGYLKELLSKKSTAGETPILCVCLRYGDRARLEFIMDKIEEVGGEELLAEQISKKRQTDGMTCFYALCKFARKYDSLSLLVGKMFQFFDRRYLREELLNTNHPYLECILARSLLSLNQQKFLFLIVGLYSITGLFAQQYSRLDEQNRATMSRICNIASGDWSRTQAADSTMCDLIGEIKKFIFNQNNNSSEEEIDTATIINQASSAKLHLNNNSNYNDPAVLRAMFDQFDYNGDGVLSRGEILPMMMHFFKNASPKEIERKVKEFDTNSDGTFSFEEFSKLAMSVQKQRDDEDYDFL